ncbi:5'/3'-nucleotidase SurE [Paramagnetospirillum magneticum]|uniref:5'-nucleotidase SurE n=1 Tax=Paramagnetospirillum magneticum (strain ATCC 700264 / AMB-1) TaxID=342108 RepID=SURE_PARM1|nr:5'/3'-nucleotidase SurE [Paramagnetospirillum magneticum]Q2W4A1.1 RecName: Full=5'-nucleotidase SurE; AltName: Full=Nucleoside 5'-monophosphate phosphohydrolase [Paramagnetospirillum magneticum AMB-1]BAE51324.1 Predicted acid phosphatase [Paramagnetospirillum magneticum AMB-1]
MTFPPVADPSSLRILISNDDGINAPGIKVLERIARTLSKDVWVVAPETEQSAAGHSLTIRRPLRVRKVSARRYAVDGTPTDSVLLGVNHVLKGKKPDLVLSGINRGANLGEDVTYSGTVAAAMEGTILGIPAIALSQTLEHPHPVKWGTVEHWAPDVIRRLLAKGWSRNVLINVNFPDVIAASVTGIEITRQGKRKIGDEIMERHDPRGEAYVWIGAQRAEDRSKPGTDIEAVFRGAISVTPLCFDLTHRDDMKALETAF